MGFFSWDCMGCGHSIKAPYNLAAKNKWQNDVVVIKPEGDKFEGKYDGYGRIDDEDVFPNSTVADTCAWWHERCWDDAMPADQAFSEPSPHAHDQGYFYDLDPKTGEPIKDSHFIMGKKK